MPFKRSRKRTGPWRTRNWVCVRGVWKKIVYFQGYEMRQTHPDLDIMFWRGDGRPESEMAGTDEIWMDSCYAAETPFQLKVYGIESMRRWWTRDANDRYPPYAQQRAYLKRELCLPLPAPPFIERSEWDSEHQLTIQYVRGEIARQYHDPHFMFGGHDLIYPSYIKTPRTVWVDVRQDPREVPYTLLHEITERKLMEKGWSYDDAHRRATEIELMARARKHLVWPVRKEKRLMEMKLAPLPVTPLAQEGDAACGPASMRMILNALGRTYQGKPFTEKRLVELCGCTDDGTDHEKLIKGANRVGASVFVKEHGTLDELRFFILKERLPVLIGWWPGPERTLAEIQSDHDLDEGHFSVATHVTKSRLVIADPWIPELEDGGLRRLPLSQFMRQSDRTRPAFSWCDTDTPEFLPTNRWYMVLNFEGKTWSLPGGRNY